MKLRDLFQSNITRDIPPVVYFHEQTPAKLAAEVDEYIITGGFPPEHPHRQRVPSGIREHQHTLANAVCCDRPSSVSWISVCVVVRP